MKLTRYLQKIFGINSQPEDLGVIGSLADGAPDFATNPEEMQALSRFESGLRAVVIGDNSPAIEDINSMYYMITYQLAYLMQNGVPEWNADTEYFTGNIVRNDEGLFRSLADNNIGNEITDATKWSSVNASNSALNVLQNLSLRDPVVLTGATNPIVSARWSSVDYSEEKRIFVAVSRTISSNNSVITWSYNGKDWFNSTEPSITTSYTYVKYIPLIGKFLMGAKTSGDVVQIYSSVSGVSWTLENSFTGTSEITSIESSGSIIVLTRLNGKIHTSTNGTSWTQRTSPSSYIPMVSYSPLLGRFLAIDSNIGAIYSNDGISWTSVAIADAELTDVMWCESIKKFVLSGRKTSTTNSIVYTSFNGQSFSVVNPIDESGANLSGGVLTKIDYSNEMNVFVSFGQYLRTSVDLIHWFINGEIDFNTSSSFNDFPSCYSKNLSKFVALNANNTGSNEIYNSR